MYRQLISDDSLYCCRAVSEDNLKRLLYRFTKSDKEQMHLNIHTHKRNVLPVVDNKPVERVMEFKSENK